MLGHFSGFHPLCSVQWVGVLSRPCSGAQAVSCSGRVFHQGPAVGPRQRTAMGVCPPKALRWGLEGGGGLLPVGLVWVDGISVVKREAWARCVRGQTYGTSKTQRWGEGGYPFRGRPSQDPGQGFRAPFRARQTLQKTPE